MGKQADGASAAGHNLMVLKGGGPMGEAGALFAASEWIYGVADMSGGRYCDGATSSGNVSARGSKVFGGKARCA